MFNVYTYVCSRAHMCVPIGHVFAFQANTLLLSDEHTGVCSGRTFMRAFTRAHMCVHVYTFVCSTCTHRCVPLGHVFVFQVDRCVFHVNTLLCAR